MPIRFTAKAMQGNKDFAEEMFGENEAGIVISTYTMISYAGKRNETKQSYMDAIQKIDWGLLLLDEVQVVPANTF